MSQSAPDIQVQPRTERRAVLIHREELDTYAIDDEAIVYDRARDTVHYLNHTARCVWESCDGFTSSAVIARRLASQFARQGGASSDERDSIERGIGEAIDLLRRDGLLTTAGEA